MARDPNRPMNFTVSLDVTLHDLAEWSRAFGTTSRDQIRADAKTYIAELAKQGIRDGGQVRATVEIKN